MEKDFDYAIKFCEHDASDTWDDIGPPIVGF